MVVCIMPNSSPFQVVVLCCAFYCTKWCKKRKEKEADANAVAETEKVESAVPLMKPDEERSKIEPNSVVVISETEATKGERRILVSYSQVILYRITLSSWESLGMFSVGFEGRQK